MAAEIYILFRHASASLLLHNRRLRGVGPYGWTILDDSDESPNHLDENGASSVGGRRKSAYAGCRRNRHALSGLLPVDAQTGS